MLYEKCERIIREWDQWSPAEQGKMDTLVEEIMDHVINGGKDKFLNTWIKNVLMPALAAQGCTAFA